MDDRADPPLADWLDTYLAGGCSRDEEARAAQYLAAHPHVARRVEHLRSVLGGPTPTPPPATSEIARLLARVREGDSSQARGSRPGARAQHDAEWVFERPKRLNPPRLSEKRSQRWLGGVLFLCATVIVIGGMWPRTRLASRLSEPRELVSARYASYATRAGELAVVDLGAGVRAQLGPMTTLTRGTTRAGAPPIVTVIGQALFSVTGQHVLPVTVRAGDVLTRVLGTTFSVQRYPTEHKVRVVVADGRVVVQRPATIPASNLVVPIIMGARTVVDIPDSGRVSVTPNIAVDDYIAWTTGRLVFHNTPVPVILSELNRAYDAEIRLSDSSLAENALTITIPVRAHSLDDVLQVLVLTLDAHYRRVGRAVTILPGRATSRRPFPPMTQTSERSYGR